MALYRLQDGHSAYCSALSSSGRGQIDGYIRIQAKPIDSGLNGPSPANIRSLRHGARDDGKEEATYTSNRQSNHLVHSEPKKRAEVEPISRTRISVPKGFLSLYSVLCVYLAVMVFAWGTNYKLSLYKAERQSSPAKVCTRGSDAAKNALDHAIYRSAVAQAPLRTVLFSLSQGGGGQPLNLLRDEAVIDLSPLSRAPILYLRPPPDQRRTFD
jgi:hypothetical protein